MIYEFVESKPDKMLRTCRWHMICPLKWEFKFFHLFIISHVYIKKNSGKLKYLLNHCSRIFQALESKLASCRNFVKDNPRGGKQVAASPTNSPR